jgi:hypothetical protein
MEAYKRVEGKDNGKVVVYTTRNDVSTLPTPLGNHLLHKEDRGGRVFAKSQLFW